jgi:hypothetical protein
MWLAVTPNRWFARKRGRTTTMKEASVIHMIVVTEVAVTSTLPTQQ